ncbi:hypothetical protein sscle_16g107760 [Sclerotinia sclerotiorum 1980 UF-70]|nr:hypothetical protein sscle_16g107760 [Sclerotinia sclerotiorum 1980 UF-70]
MEKVFTAKLFPEEGNCDAFEAIEKEIYRDGLRKSGDTDFFALISQTNLAGYMERRKDIKGLWNYNGRISASLRRIIDFRLGKLMPLSSISTICLWTIDIAKKLISCL